MKTLDINQIQKDSYEVKVYKDIITKHIIYISDEAYLKYSKNDITKEQLVKKTFLFLLSKEKNTSILEKFDIEDIEKFFPEFNNFSEMGWLDIKG